MKTLFFPYLTLMKVNGWASNVVFTNRGQIETIIEYIYDSTVFGGNRIVTQTELIPGRGSSIYTPVNQGKYCLEVNMSDNVFASATIFGPEGSVGKPYEIVEMQPEESSGLKKWVPSAFWEIQGNPICQYLRTDYMSMIKIATIKTHYQDESKHVLIILDSCPLNGSCPNHPDAAHSSKGDGVDFRYFKFDDGSYDYERQAFWYNELIKLSPKVYCRTHSMHITELKKTSLYDQIKDNVKPDDNPTYNHDTHVHVEWS